MMLILALIYIAIAFGMLVALAAMILKIGSLLGECPAARQAARAAAVTIATGFCAIGAGGVALIGGALPLVQSEPAAGLMVALGLAALCLGLGFTHAVGTLRAVVKDAPAGTAA
ncbi:hypothetical protein SUH3_15310 [Pseudosulfitobacter pseudonitzschiae]|uniref:Uncharacterized protein n=2 Tax=Pseudosulfitobacter pseudonitzschiae TaxID=1402135 RepID=A0A073JG80_9RHOB|nr:hypothetical protein [Pseudosulfitobacter pseudonitzschiae]KEJ96722.1 hypothetical protein SUH3_15310 [Pseudosulfitobacter pseudonitzschiae]QKS07824.1 hypothetical protein HT745_04625 [Pseudosulfitobacter pseudonitzschiae]